MDHETTDKIDKLETQLIEQDFRISHILYKVLCRKTLFPDSDAKQRATINALVWGVVFSPASIVIGGGFAALLTAFFMYQQTAIMRTSVEATNKIIVKVDELSLAKGEGLVLTVSFSNPSNYPIYLEDLHCVMLFKRKLPELNNDTPSNQPSEYARGRLQPSNDRVIAPKSFGVVRYQMLETRSAFLNILKDETEHTNEIATGTLVLPASSRNRIVNVPTEIPPNYLVFLIVRIPVRTSHGVELEMYSVSWIGVEMTASGMDSDGQITEQRYEASGEIWPAIWTEVIEGNFDTSSLIGLNNLMRDASSSGFPPSVIPLDSLKEEIAIQAY